MSNGAITWGILASLGVLLLIAIFGPSIRNWYRSSRDKMRTALARRRQKR